MQSSDHHFIEIGIGREKHKSQSKQRLAKYVVPLKIDASTIGKESGQKSSRTNNMKTKPSTTNRVYTKSSPLNVEVEFLKHSQHGEGTVSSQNSRGEDRSNMMVVENTQNSRLSSEYRPPG